MKRLPLVPTAALLFLAGLGGGGEISAQLPSPSPGEEEAQGLQVLERASERYAGIDAFCGAFEQEMNVPLLRQVTRSRGRLCQARPDHFLMDFSDPEGDVVVADGEHLWVYFPSTDPGQVFRSDLSASDGRFDFHREFLEDPGEKYRPEYRGEEVVDGRSTHVVSLTPLEPSPYVRAQVWIDAESALIRKVEIHEDNESVRTVVLRDLEIEPQISASLFEFEPPSGVQVIVR